MVVVLLGSGAVDRGAPEPPPEPGEGRRGVLRDVQRARLLPRTAGILNSPVVPLAACLIEAQAVVRADDL